MRLIDIAPYEISGHACMMYTTEEGSLVQTFTSDIPTIDAVPVVRCIDCYHITPVEGGLPLCTLHNIACAYNDFCSYGERKEGDV